ncbi:MAG: hypothetical protein HQ547_07295 [Candidatus Omnitrophica bacterium]|nr:hypothetical protein [Candidatus Omnitrophota bacterium]
MGIIDKVKGLPTPLFILHFASKAVVAFGLGIVLGSRLEGLGWLIVGLGVVLSIPAVIRIFGK